MLGIEKVLRDFEMDHENKLQNHARRGFCFAVFFLKFSESPTTQKKKGFR